MALGLLAASIGLLGCGTSSEKHEAAASYDTAVLSMHPYAFYRLSGKTEDEPDLAAGNSGRWMLVEPMRHADAKLPNGTPVVDFRPGDYLQVGSRPGLSIPRAGAMTVITWIRPDTLQFTQTEGSGYVYVLGKGESGAQEWAFRMYTRDNSELRPNRISVYVWNPSGGEGSGAYFQDSVTVGRWIMLAAVIDSASSQQYPSGSVAIFKDGVQRQQVGLDQFHVTPQPGGAPLRIGTRDLASYFQGAIGDVAIFDRALTPVEVRLLYDSMFHKEQGQARGPVTLISDKPSGGPRW